MCISLFCDQILLEFRMLPEFPKFVVKLHPLVVIVFFVHTEMMIAHYAL